MSTMFEEIRNNPRLFGMAYGIAMQSAMRDRSVSYKHLVDALFPPPVRVEASEHETHRAIFRRIIKPGEKYNRPVPDPFLAEQAGYILFKWVQHIIERREVAMKADRLRCGCPPHPNAASVTSKRQ